MPKPPTTPLATLRKAVSIFEALPCKYCLIGGHAASLYRSQERLTKDVDFALLADTPLLSRELAERAIELIGLRPMLGFIPASPKEQRRKAICMVTSVATNAQSKGVIDILLPELPWIARAVERAQSNKIDLGFKLVPVITPEDLILAKCYALRNSPDRFQDLDDIKEIFNSMDDLDTGYLKNSLVQHKLTIPKLVRKFAPKELK